jgi:hypothetical protein
MVAPSSLSFIAASYGIQSSSQPTSRAVAIVSFLLNSRRALAFVLLCHQQSEETTTDDAYPSTHAAHHAQQPWSAQNARFVGQFWPSLAPPPKQR